MISNLDFFSEVQVAGYQLYSLAPRPPAVKAGQLLKLLKHCVYNLARCGGLLITLLFPLLFSGCPDSGVNPPPNPLGLTVENVTSTQAFLKLSLDQSETQRVVTLKRGDSTVFSDLRLLTSDTLVVDEGLLPNKTYTYTLGYQSFIVTAQTTTMDTTSHDITWQSWTFGGEPGTGSSTLYDVSIINDTLAYAVGEIYLKDSLGNFDPNAYNLMKWNGHGWKLLRVKFYTVCGQESRSSYSASSIFVFSESDIWIAMAGDQIARWDGNKQTATMCLPVSFSVRKIWGESTNSVYVVGDGGNILHYTNGLWAKIESGTAAPIIDIWGVVNNGTTVYCAVNDYFHAGNTKILTITESGKVDSLPWETDLRVSSVWTKNGYNLYACGDRIFKREAGTWQQLSVPLYYYETIRGNEENNIIAVGQGGIVVHYNGRTWQNYPDLLMNDVVYYGLDVKNHTIVLVGLKGAQAIVTIGKQQ